MASYLEAYGSHEELRAKRIRVIKIVSLLAIAALVAAAILYSAFRNFSEESRVKNFLQLLRNQQYQDAYRMWGCTETHPCPNYSFPTFRSDWGPEGAHANAASANIQDSESCGSGVLIRVAYPNAEPVALWVERGTGVVSFSPWKECPGRHWRFKQFFKSLAGK